MDATRDLKLSKALFTSRYVPSQEGQRQPDFRFSFSDFYYYALFTKYNKINIYRNYMKYKKKEIKQYITRKIVLSDQSSISFRVGH